jgi:hypothetical protein
VNEAITAPFLVAALVLAVAGASKLRAPASAATALGVSPLMVRAFAVVEVALGSWGAASAARLPAGMIACAYGAFAAIAARLAGRRSACGCFGEDDAPTSNGHAVLSAVLATAAGIAVFWRPHGLGWILGRPTVVVWIAVLGVSAAAYATVLAYTELPRAWGAWRGGS